METRHNLRKFALLLALCVVGASLAVHARADTSFNVNTAVDEIDQDTADGICLTSTGHCSLRAAIMQANHLSAPGTTHIVLPANNYILTRPAIGADGEDNGDLNFTVPLAAGQIISIEGDSAASTVIDANQIDRVIYVNQNRVVNFSKVTLRGGKRTNDTGGGGRIDGMVSMQDSIIADNVSASGHCGGFWVIGQLDVLRSKFVSNQAGGEGGAVLVSGEATFRETTMTANRSRFGGAIQVISADSHIYVIDSTISGNSAAYGGGISNNLGQAFIINSTISGNTSNLYGGGIYNNGTTWLYNTSVINNDASHDRNPPGGSGGGVYNQPGQRLVATNTLIAGNTMLDAPIPDDCNGVLEVYGWNLLADDTGCSFSGNGIAARGQVSTNTIGPLANNGGPTMTHALLAGSEAIDTTTAQGCVGPTLALLATDQRGAPRIAGPKCDVGAYEYGSVVPTTDLVFSNGFD